MDSKERLKRYNQISPMLLKRGKTEAEIWESIDRKIEERKNSVEIDVLVTDKEERKIARSLVAKYQEDYSIVTVSDKSDLLNLIYLQILNTRLQKKFEIIDKETIKQTFPLKILDALHSNQREIAELKKKLGIRKDDVSKQTDSFKTLEQLKQKVKIWQANNQGSRTIVCPCCGQMVLLKIRTEAWEALQHPFFKDKILFSEHLVRLYLEKKITREDVAKILECSKEYIDWLVDKRWVDNPKYKEINEKEEEKHKDQ